MNPEFVVINAVVDLVTADAVRNDDQHEVHSFSNLISKLALLVFY